MNTPSTAQSQIPSANVSDITATENSAEKKNVLLVYANAMPNFVRKEVDGEKWTITNYKDQDDELIKNLRQKLSAKANLSTIDEHAIRISTSDSSPSFTSLTDNEIKAFDEVVILLPTAAFHDAIVKSEQTRLEDDILKKIRNNMESSDNKHTRFTIINSTLSHPHEQDENVIFLKRKLDKVHFDHIKECDHTYGPLPCGTSQLDAMVNDIIDRNNGIQR